MTTLINAKGNRCYDFGGHFCNGLLLLCASLCIVTSLMQTFAQGWATSVTGDLDSNASAVVGGIAELPCEITPETEDDKTHLVLWYKQDSVNPIYTLDLRDRKAPTPTQFPPGNIRSRTSFFLNSSSPYLLIKNVHADDQGLYRCRVDFKNTRSRNRHVNLNVVVPPSIPTLLDEKGLDLETRIGPYNEGSSLFLSCEVKGGRPPPRVTWWRDSIMLDESYEVASMESVRNDLLVQSLSRSDFNETYTCQATNNNITPAVSSSVTVDMNLKPLEISILNERKPLVANKQYVLVCQSTGSRPPPIIAWWKDEKRIKSPRTNETVSPDSNVTTSILRFTPTREDNGKYIWCRAANPIIPGSSIQDGWLLDIHYIPKVMLKPGDLVKMDNILEGDDVYFDCVIMANPGALRVEWQFQGRTLAANSSGGIFTSNKSMILQKVKRQNSGSYSCVATNEQGEGESKGLVLQVKHAPICQPNLKTVFRVAREETVKILCEVEAYPSDVVFKWTSNQTMDNGEDMHFQYTSENTKSVLTYIPKAEKDFGNLYCWAGNDMGFQKMPCIFTVEPAGPPDPVNNCSIVNQTQTAINIDCRSGYDGGLPQTFIFEIYDPSNPELKRNLTSSKPSFLINELRPGMNYVISIYALNHKGRSEPLSVATETLKDALVDDNGSEKLLTTILGVVIGIVVALALIGITILIVMRLKASSNRSKRKDYPPSEHADRSNVPLRKDMDDCLDNEEKSPDIICSTNEQEFPTVKVRCLQKWAYGSDVPCENCLRHQGMPTFPGAHIGCGSENAPSCRYPLRKIQPLEESSQPDIQMQANHGFRIGERKFLGLCAPNSCNSQDGLNSVFHYIEDANNGIGNRQESSV